MLLRLRLTVPSLLSAALACTGSSGDDSTTTAATTGASLPGTGTGDAPTGSSLPTSDTTATGGTGDTGNAEATSLTATTQSETTQGIDTVATTLTTDLTTGATAPDDTTAGTTLAGTTGPGDTTAGTTSADTTSADTSTGEPPPPSDIEVIITADNAYSFAYGTEDNISKFFGGVEAVTAGQIFNCGEGPEKYVIPAADALNATFLYIVAWDDSAVTNGVLARFRRKDGGNGFGDDVFTGTKGWEACATGLKYQIGSGGPTLATINEYILKCNDSLLDPNTSSAGWVDEVGTPIGAVAFGEDNTTPYDGGPKAGNEFPLVCPADMPPEARWMWFNWDPANVVPPQSPFLFPGGQNPYHQFLLFRFAAELVPEPQ